MPPTISRLKCSSLPKPVVEVKIHSNEDEDAYACESIFICKPPLSTSTEVFLNKLTTVENNFIIEINNYSHSAVDVFLKFILGEKPLALDPCDGEFLFQLYRLSEEFDVRELKSLVLEALSRLKVNEGNFLALLKVVQDNSQSQEAYAVLKNILIRFVTAKLKSIEEIAALITEHTCPSGTLSLNISIWKLLTGVSVKKTVRFSDLIQKQIYDINSAIIAKTAKNKKKAEKKRKAQEKRISESSGSSFEDKVLSDALANNSLNMSNDSGLASSLEESFDTSIQCTRSDDGCVSLSNEQLLQDNIFKIEF